MSVPTLSSIPPCCVSKETKIIDISKESMEPGVIVQEFEFGVCKI
jgi:hypothetical protein